MLKQIFILSIFILSGLYSHGQYYFYDDKYMDNDILFEGGVSLGLMNAVADVGEKKGNGLSPAHYDWKSSKLNAAIYGAVMYKSIVEGRIQLTKGSVAGNDANSNSPYERSKNFNFQSGIFELSLMGIFHPIMLLNIDYLPVLSPYIMAGAGVFSFYPKTKYKGQVISLRKLNTEGQNSTLYPARKQYSLRAVSLPIGGGLKYEFSGIYNIRFEVLYRFTSTDYIDDVSTTYVDRSVFPTDMQKILAHRYLELNPGLDRTGFNRGNGTSKDHFFSINLNFGYVIGREKRTLGKTR